MPAELKFMTSLIREMATSPIPIENFIWVCGGKRMDATLYDFEYQPDLPHLETLPSWLHYAMIHVDNNPEHQSFDAHLIITVAPVTHSFDAIWMSQNTTSVNTKENTFQHIALSTNISVVDHIPVFDVTKFLTNVLNKKQR